MSILFDHSKVVVSKRSFEFDGHKVAYSVTERATDRLIGHVAKTRSAIYGRKFGPWCYLPVSEPRDGTTPWTLAWTRTDAVDNLMSAYAPCGIFTGELV